MRTEDYILIAGNVLTALALALGVQPQYALLGTVLGAIGKGLMSYREKST